MDKLIKNTKSERKLYFNDYKKELNITNQKRIFIVFIVMFILELVITIMRVSDGSAMIENLHDWVSLAKLTGSLLYVVIYLIFFREEKLSAAFSMYSYFMILFLAIGQEYLLAVEVYTEGTIYNHLYLVIILAWGLLIMPKVILPLFIAIAASAYVILITYADQQALTNNVFPLLVFSVIGPFASYVAYSTHFNSYIRMRKFDHTSQIDTLTEIYNRRGFEQRLKIKMNEYNRQEDRVSVMMIDIDNFKMFNDTYGHDMGDKCLKIIASVFDKTLVGAGDIFARYGGEEFVVAILGRTDEESYNFAEQIRRNIEKTEIPNEENNFVNVTVSIGMFSCYKKTIISIEEILKKADKNLYSAKAQGKNMVVKSSDLTDINS